MFFSYNTFYNTRTIKHLTLGAGSFKYSLFADHMFNFVTFNEVKTKLEISKLF